MSTLLYTAKPCGCLCLVLVNDAENVKACAKEIAAEARAGHVLHESTKDDLPPMTCAEHKETRYAKTAKTTPTFGQPATGRR